MPLIFSVSVVRILICVEEDQEACLGFFTKGMVFQIMLWSREITCLCVQMQTVSHIQRMWMCLSHNGVIRVAGQRGKYSLVLRLFSVFAD